MDEEVYERDDIIVRAWDSVRRMREAERRELEFNRVGVPSLTAQSMAKDLNRNWVLAAIEAGRLMQEVLERLAKYERLHDFDLTDNELEIAQIWGTSHRTSRIELAHLFDVTPEVMAQRINRVYKKTGTKSRRELYYALKLKGLVQD